MNEDKVMRHKKLCDGLNTLYARKNHDYGDSFHQTFIEEDMAMPRIRLGDKFSRFKTLTQTGGQQVTDESIRDTLLDLANYAIMTVLEMEENEYSILYADGKPTVADKGVNGLKQICPYCGSDHTTPIIMKFPYELQYQCDDCRGCFTIRTEGNTNVQTEADPQ